MADQNQLPRLPAMRYFPENDIPATHPRQTGRYIQGIKDALRRIELLEEYLDSEDRGLSSACIELAFSMKHYLQMFKNITMSIENPSNKVKGIIERINEIEAKIEYNDTIKEFAGRRSGSPCYFTIRAGHPHNN